MEKTALMFRRTEQAQTFACQAHPLVCALARTWCGTRLPLTSPFRVSHADKPNVFDFGTPYTEIHRHLKAMDEKLYTQMGLLTMLDRNIKTKNAPQRWQDETKRFDVVVTFEERVFDAVVQGGWIRARACLPATLADTDTGP